MIGTGEVGSYQNTYDHTLQIFAAKDPVAMAKNSGTQFDPFESRFTLESLGQKLSIQYPEGTVLFSGSDISPLWGWRLIILNHLARADDAPLTGRLITYRETQGGNLFNSAYQKMSILPLINASQDQTVGKIKEACLALGGSLQDGADISARFDFLPRFPVTMKIWQPDDEMDGSANLLFDANANHYLHTEDIAVAASLIVNFLIKQCELMYPEIC
jgi:hypothetical protein